MSFNSDDFSSNLFVKKLEISFTAYCNVGQTDAYIICETNKYLKEVETQLSEYDLDIYKDVIKFTEFKRVGNKHDFVTNKMTISEAITQYVNEKIESYCNIKIANAINELINTKHANN